MPLAAATALRAVQLAVLLLCTLHTASVRSLPDKLAVASLPALERWAALGYNCTSKQTLVANQNFTRPATLLDWIMEQHGAAALINSTELTMVPEQHATVLLTREGVMYNKEYDPDFEALLALPATSRAPLQAGSQQLSNVAPSAGVKTPAAALPAAAVPVAESPCPLINCPGGVDDRTAVSNTTVFPFSAIGQLSALLASSSAAAGKSTAFCTGVLLTQFHVLTAAHCVYDQATQQALTGWVFVPALNGSTQPVGEFHWTNARFLQAYVDVGTNLAEGLAVSYADVFNWDFALVTLDSPAPINQLGYMALRNPSLTPNATSINLTTAGYPKDKGTNYMYQASCGLTVVPPPGGDSNILFHKCDSVSGQSGSPIYDPAFLVRAVLTGEMPGVPLDSSASTTSSSLPPLLVATDIDDFVYDVVMSWYTEDATGSAT